MDHTQIDLPGYVVFEDRIQIDKKVKAIKEWPNSQNIHDVQSLHDLASFYLCFIKNFFITAPITGCIKQKFIQMPSDEKSWHKFELKMQAAILALPDFDSVWGGVWWYNIGISIALSQEGRPVAYFSELNGCHHSSLPISRVLCYCTGHAILVSRTSTNITSCFFLNNNHHLI